jgi:hypothetical protein
MCDTGYAMRDVGYEKKRDVRRKTLDVISKIQIVGTGSCARPHGNVPEFEM